MTGSDPSTTEGSNSISHSNLNVVVTYEDAKRLVDQGFSVFAIKPRDKVPAVDSWKEFQERKPTDGELHTWFDRGDKNIGIVCGKISRNLVVVDFDDPAMLSFLFEGEPDKFIEKAKEKTLVVKTRKGWHVYFRVPEKLLQSGRFNNLKIDIKGEGGYVVAPPSIHREGARYEFLNDKDVEFNEKFDKFLEKLEEKDKEYSYARQILNYWDKGRRNFIIVGFTVYAKQRLKWGLEKITDFMKGINRVKPFIEDPYHKGELEAKIKNAYEKGYAYESFLSDNIGTDELLKTLEKIAPKYTEKENENLYFPGPARIAEALKEKYILKTIPELGTDKEQIFYFDGAIYKRAEEFIKEQSHKEYLRQFKEVLEIAEQEGNKEYTMKMKRALDKGPSMNDINEVLGIIRRTTFSIDEINPDGYIPFKNRLLNLKTGELEPFDPSLFYTYQIDANLLDKYITLNDIPLFKYLLNSVFDPEYIPTILSYLAYCLYPRLPNHKVLFIVGRERIGKGTLVRVLKGLMPHGSASISLARILTAERFKFQGVEGKNLLIDMETRRKFKRGTVLDWTAFANLFGEDILNIEPKGKESHDYISRAKGIFLGNLPFINIDDHPAVSRILLAETKSKRPKKVFKELHEIILEKEKDKIATLLVQILFKLKENNFEFPLPGFIIRKHKQEMRALVELYEKTIPIDLRSPEHGLFPFKKETRLEVDNEKVDDLTGEILEKLADPVENFIEEMVEEDPEARTSYDEAYGAFEDYCSRKGITVLKRQTFLKNFGYHFGKRKLGPRGNQIYYFMGCRIEPYEKNDEQEEVEIPDQKTLLEMFPELKGSIQVGYASNDKNPLKNTGSENNSNGIQLASSTNRVRNERENENKEYNNKKDIAHKLDTGGNNQKPSENKAPEDNKPVSNLNEPPLPAQEPDPKKDDELNQRAIEFLNALKNKLQFLRPPEEHLVTREPDNVIRYLHHVKGLSEHEARAIVSKWEELNLARVAKNQFVLSQAQEDNKNDNH